MNTPTEKSSLFRATFISAIAFASATSAHAQTAPADTNEAPEEETIVVTGSILRRVDTETPSPVTILSTESLEQRGVNTVAEGLQRLAANGSGMISEGWNNGNNFAAGANAVSLRGLTVQYTLTMFDGLRMAPYPLADDGHRNFVDLSTIPDAIVERIEVLKDGASSTYGADAVAGVVNIITKREVKGIHANISGGISSRGDAGEKRADLTVGHGDLEEDGFNVYVTGMYRKNDALWARERGYPFNSGYLGNICNEAGDCMATPTRWYTFGVNPDGTRAGSANPLAPIVAIFDPTTNGRLATSSYQLLNPNCSAFGANPITLPASARSGVTYAPEQCEGDLKNLYGTLRPQTERYGLSARATFKLGDRAEVYVMGNYMKAKTQSQLPPRAFSDVLTPPTTLTATIVPVLPVYVCAAGIGTVNPTTGIIASTGCNAQNGTLNPYNPFAASGQTAILQGRYDRPATDDTNSRALRGAAGVQGTFGNDDDWNYQVEFTASEVRLARSQANYLIPQGLATAIAQGAYNFAQPWLNSEAVRDLVSPTSVTVSRSKLWQVHGILGRKLFELPGGSMQAAVGVAYRKESIDSPSANPENLANPASRYYTINAVGVKGSRNVKSAFYEISAPVIDQVELNASGRYDKYSSGQENFSPKFGAKFKPIEQVVLRGTWSKGFRIPSFNEAFGLPTTGYTTTSVDCVQYAAFCALHPDPGGGLNNYVTNQFSLGRTSIGNPELEPEKSTAWTLGVVFEPMRNLSFTFDYYNIKVKNIIGNVSSEDQDAALDAYLTSGVADAVPGVIVRPGANDPQNPNARALPGFIEFSFTNSDSLTVEGFDFGFDFRHDFGAVEFVSSLDANYLLKYQIRRKSGAVERYDGTLSPCDYTSCSGSPKWRGNWENTLIFGDFSVTGTAYYTHGYSLASIDYGGVRGSSEEACLESIGASVIAYKGTTIPVKCRVGAQWNFDLAASLKVNDNFTFYMNALNVFDIKPKFDPSAAYSIFQYNPAFGQANMIGRYFRFGVKVDY